MFEIAVLKLHQNIPRDSLGKGNCWEMLSYGLPDKGIRIYVYHYIGIHIIHFSENKQYGYWTTESLLLIFEFNFDPATWQLIFCYCAVIAAHFLFHFFQINRICMNSESESNHYQQFLFQWPKNHWTGYCCVTGGVGFHYDNIPAQ